MKTDAVVNHFTPLRKLPSADNDEWISFAVRKILAPIDLSPASEKALSYAVDLAGEFGSEITLLYILEPMASTFEELLVTVPEPPNGNQLSKAEKILKALAARVRGRGIDKVKAAFRRGIASHEIVEAATELDVDLIVIATHGFTGWKHFAIGTTAKHVAHAAPCPVLVVGERSTILFR